MSTATPLLADLARQGVTVALAAGKLKLTGVGGQPPAELLDRIKEHREQIIAELSGAEEFSVGAVDPADWQERAAIREYDGGMDRTAAEKAAAADCGIPNRLELYVAPVIGWGENIAGMASADASEGDMRLAGLLHSFCEVWGVVAARMGWDAVALFGVDPLVADPLTQRRDRHGAVIQWATSVQAGLTIFAIDEGGMTFRTEGGTHQRAPRFHPARDEAVPIWEAMGAASSQGQP